MGFSVPAPDVPRRTTRQDPTHVRGLSTTSATPKAPDAPAPASPGRIVYIRRPALVLRTHGIAVPTWSRDLWQQEESPEPKIPAAPRMKADAA